MTKFGQLVKIACREPIVAAKKRKCAQKGVILNQFTGGSHPNMSVSVFFQVIDPPQGGTHCPGRFDDFKLCRFCIKFKYTHFADGQPKLSLPIEEEVAEHVARDVVGPIRIDVLCLGVKAKKSTAFIDFQCPLGEIQASGHPNFSGFVFDGRSDECTSGQF